MLGIYTRLSRQDDASNSIGNQKREGIAFAKKHKLTYEIYDEGEGVSGGTEIALRPVLDQLMKDIAVKKITHVWFRNQNRLERNSVTFHLFANHAIKHDTKVYFDNKLEDWNDPQTYLMSSVVSAFNAYKVTLQSYQTKRTLLDNVKEGKSFGIYPYGYTSNDKGLLVVDNEEKEIVKLIYKLSLEGKGTRSIAEFLNDKKIPTRYNKIGKGTMTVKNKYTDVKTTKEKKDIKWSGNSVRGIIVNTIYKGERKWKGEIYEAPKIFDESYWEKVNNNLSNNKNNTGKKVEHKYLLKGILECGLCGRNMYGRTRVSKKDHYYMCSSKRYKDLNCGNRSINIDFIEMYLWGLLFYRSEIKKSMMQGNTKDFDISIDDLNERKRKHFAELKSVTKKREKFIDIAGDGLITKKELETRLDKLDRDRADVVIKLKQIKDEMEFMRKAEKLKGEMSSDINNLKFNTPFNKKKELINKYLKRVKVLYVDELDIYIIKARFQMSSKETIYPINVKPSKFREYVDSNGGGVPTAYKLDDIKNLVEKTEIYQEKFYEPKVDISK